MKTFKLHDHILFIGDSITHAHRRPEEVHDCYRFGCGYVNHVAAALSLHQPELALRFTNRGECGHGLSDLSKRWETDCLSLQPQVVSILVGINESKATPEKPFDPQAYLHNYVALLDRTISRMPEVRVVVLEPFGVAIPSSFAAPVPVIAPERLANVRKLQPFARQVAQQAGANFVPLQNAFDEMAKHVAPQQLALDGIHPSVLGHALIAQQWLKHVTGSSHPLAELAGFPGAISSFELQTKVN